MLFNFTKMHGLGNDMILIDDREEKIRNINEFARRILHFSPKQHVKIGRYAKIEIPT